MFNLFKRWSCKLSQIGAQVSLVCSFLFSTCLGRLCALHQEKQLCLCDTWYLLFCVYDCLVCRSICSGIPPAYQTVIQFMRHLVLYIMCVCLSGVQEHMVLYTSCIPDSHPVYASLVTCYSVWMTVWYYAKIGTCYSVCMAVSYVGAYAPAYLLHTSCIPVIQFMRHLVLVILCG